MDIRRIVTGHDADGKAIITSDQVMDNVITMKSGNKGALIWVTDETPSGVDGDEDPSTRTLGIGPPKNGNVFRILELPPGKDPFMHRTDTIDYCIVLEGECVMLLDDNAEVAMKQGDVMVQRGTWHGWANRSDKNCRLAFILIGSKPPAKHLHAEPQKL
jgi:quercetin dioxygenase-like cupin family protein